MAFIWGGSRDGGSWGWAERGQKTFWVSHVLPLRRTVVGNIQEENALVPLIRSPADGKGMRGEVTGE